MDNNSLNNNGGKFTIRMSPLRQQNVIVPPSPARAALDPQYASKLNLKRRVEAQSDVCLMPPPDIHRGVRSSNLVTTSNFCTPSQSFASSSTETAMEVVTATVSSVADSRSQNIEMTDADNNSIKSTNPISPIKSSSPYQTPERFSDTSAQNGKSSTSSRHSSQRRRSINASIASAVSPVSSYNSSGFNRNRVIPHTPSPKPRVSGSFFGCNSPGITPGSSSRNRRSRSFINSMTPTTSKGISNMPNSQNDSFSAGDGNHSDRFIPSRVASNLNFTVWSDTGSPAPMASASSFPFGLGANSSSAVNSPHQGGGSSTTPYPSSTSDAQGEDAVSGVSTTTTTDPNQQQSNNIQQSQQQQSLLNLLLRSELLGENVDPAPAQSPSSSSMLMRRHTGTSGTNATIPSSPSASPSSYAMRQGRHGNGTQIQNNGSTSTREGGNFLQFHTSPRRSYLDEIYGEDRNHPTSIINSFSLSPIGSGSTHRLLSMPQKRKRRISKVPFKVLDAPALADDFYLNLVDWSSQNVLAVGLGSCVYLWSACTSKVTNLCDLSESSDSCITSVSWTQGGTHLAIGVHNGEVQIWDTVQGKKVRTMGGHSQRIGSLSWSGPILASGSRDRLIYLRDVRVQNPFTARLAAHKQEVCGLKWSHDEPAQLASGGNDNKLLVWDIKHHRQPVHRFAEHSAAVKAIAWSPHQYGLLASGGGTADRCIRFWNALSGSALSSIDTGSQVCNLAWSKNCNEIVSTHGYSLNQIVVWKYPTMQKVTTLTGHTYRVLYLAMSPDGSTVVTGAGDETLRFWQVFPGPRNQDKNGGNGILFPSTPGSILR